MIKLLLLFFALNTPGNHWVKVKDSNRVHAYYANRVGNIIGWYYLPPKAKYPPTPPPDAYTVQCAEGISIFGALNVRQQYRAEMIPPEPISYISGWGVAPLTHSDPSLKESLVEIDGKRLTKWEDTHRLMAVAFMWAGKDDSYTHRVAKSELMNIHDGPIDIPIPWNDELEALHNAGKTGTMYYLLLLPDGVAASRINSLNDAKDNGGYVVDKGFGAP